MTTWRSGLAQMEAERNTQCELLIGRCRPAGYAVRFLRTAVLLRACGLHGTGNSSSKLFGVATAGGRTGGYGRWHVRFCQRSGHSRSLPSGIRAKPQLPGTAVEESRIDRVAPSTGLRQVLG
jgi:hypothetical protein